MLGVLAALGLSFVSVDQPHNASAAVVAAETWKACSFNEQPMGCRDQHHADGSLTILWQNGPAMTYRLVRGGFPRSQLRDVLGVLWEREVLIQGNAVFTDAVQGNRIVVPLR